MVKINNNVPKGNATESTSLHGDFSSFPTNIVKQQDDEVVSPENAKSNATDAKGIQDTNTKLLMKSLNGQLQETEQPKAQYNPKELSVDK